MQSRKVSSRRMTGREAPEFARPFAGLTLVENCREILRMNGLSTLGSPGVIAERAMATSDLSSLLANVLDKSMRLGYGAVPGAIRRIVRETTAVDFKAKYRIQLSMAPTLLPVNEAGEYTSGVFSDSHESYAISTWGRLVTITRKTILNDDLGALNQVTRAPRNRRAEFRGVAARQLA